MHRKRTMAIAVSIISLPVLISAGIDQDLRLNVKVQSFGCGWERADCACDGESMPNCIF